MLNGDPKTSVICEVLQCQNKSLYRHRVHLSYFHQSHFPSWVHSWTAGHHSSQSHCSFHLLLHQSSLQNTEASDEIFTYINLIRFRMGRVHNMLEQYLQSFLRRCSYHILQTPLHCCHNLDRHHSPPGPLHSLGHHHSLDLRDRIADITQWRMLPSKHVNASSFSLQTYHLLQTHCSHHLHSLLGPRRIPLQVQTMTFDGE